MASAGRPRRRLPRRRDDFSGFLAGCPGAAPRGTMEAIGRAGRPGVTSVLMSPAARVVMRPYVAPGSIVRRIWGDADTILFVFAGSAAEFALNRAVDWLFYTGRLPADPLGRLFSTCPFAQDI